MYPPIAAFLCACLIIYLFWMDRNQKEGVSRAVWIPFAWMFFAGSRYLSQWLDIGTPIDTLDVYVEGHPINMAVFLGLITAGIIVLFRRRLNWGLLLLENKWIALFFLFGAISILWSDYPFVSFKRLIKATGNVIMILVVLTEERPYDAFGFIVRRLAYVLLPLSLLFIKYYPALGRAYHNQGMPMFIGVSTQKNGLGQTCLITGMYFCWILLYKYKDKIKKGGNYQIFVDFAFLALIAWLLYLANSATSISCLVIAIGIFLVCRLPVIIQRPQRIMIIGMLCIVIYVILESSFDIKNEIIKFMGRDETLTTRVPMWEHILSLAGDPIFGYGYESFWLGERQKIIIAAWGIAHSAHNGYIELYLSSGLIGLVILGLIFVSGIIKVSRALNVAFETAVLRLTIIVVVALYNWTEATFYGVNNLWLLLYLGVIDKPKENVGLSRSKNLTSINN